MGAVDRARTVRDGARRVRALIRRLRALPHQVAALDDRVASLDANLAEGRRGMVELRDSVHLVARRSALHRRPTRVLFLVHVIGAWDACNALVEMMAASDDFEPIVASIPRRFRGSDGLYGEDDVHHGLTERGVPHLRFAAPAAGETLRLVKAIEPDVIFRQSQWDADVPDELATERLSFARTCLVPYETMNIVVNVPDGTTPNTAVDSDYHRHAWLVFCTNELMLDTAVREGVRNGDRFRVVGHPKADHLRAAKPEWPLDGPERPGRVVWSAHHTIGRGWTDFGAFHLMCDSMLAWARQRADVQFVFMPHPALLPLPGSDRSPIDRPEFDAWMRAWAELPNAAVLSEADYAPVLAASDLMVTDGLSMLVEYQLFGKPVIFFEREGHRPFNAIGREIVDGVHTVHAIDEAYRLAEKFLAGAPDPLLPQQERIVARLFGDGASAERILAVLRAEITLERGGE